MLAAHFGSVADALQLAFAVSVAATVMAGAVCTFEEWPLHQGMHVTVDALMNNGSGKYAVRHAASRLVLCVSSLAGFFTFIEWMVDVMPALAGWPPLASRWVKGTKQPRRLVWVCLLWMLEMILMTATYYFDDHASDEEGRRMHSETMDRLSAAVLYAISTGCSGGFGHLSSDWIGVAYIMLSVPTTAWLARELTWYRVTNHLDVKESPKHTSPHATPDIDNLEAF